MVVAACGLAKSELHYVLHKAPGFAALYPGYKALTRLRATRAGFANGSPRL
jgi:hypothetical protein